MYCRTRSVCQRTGLVRKYSVPQLRFLSKSGALAEAGLFRCFSPLPQLGQAALQQDDIDKDEQPQMKARSE